MSFKFGDCVSVLGQSGIYWKPIEKSMTSHWVVFENDIRQCFLNDIAPIARWIDTQSVFGCKMLKQKFFSHIDGEIYFFDTRKEAREDLRDRLACLDSHWDELVEFACYGQVFGVVEETNKVPFDELPEDDERREDMDKFDYVCEFEIVDLKEEC